MKTNLNKTKMKRTLFSFILLFFIQTISINAQDDPFNIPKKERLYDFTQLKVYSGIFVNLIPSDVNKAIIYGDRYGGILLKQKGNTLKLRMRIGELFNYHNAYVDLYYKSPLQVLKLHQGAVIQTEAPLTQSKFLLKAHEGSQFEGTIETEYLVTKVRTGAMVFLSGETDEHILKVSTGGICEAQNLKSNRTQVRVFAGGEVGIFSDTQVQAHVSMGGSIGIQGKPKSVIATRTIAGEIYNQNRNPNRSYPKRNSRRNFNRFN